MNSTGSANTALGTNAGQNLTTGSDNVDIANDGRAEDRRMIRIGTKGTHRKAFLAGVSGKSIPGPAQTVLVNAQGQHGRASVASATKTAASKATTDRRFARMQAEIKRQQRQIRLLQQEVRKHG